MRVRYFIMLILFILSCEEETFDNPVDPEAVFDCLGTFEGDAVLDCAGVCNGSTVEDCTGECGGTAPVDECGICEGDNSPNTGTCDCNSTPNGTAYYDNCGNCVFGTTGALPCYELIFSDDFSASNKVLPNTSSTDSLSDWRYTAANYSTINISNNKLVIKGNVNDLAHRIYDNVLSKYPYTKLIGKIEFSADIGHISYASDAWIYGIFMSDQNSDKRYHFFFNPKSSGTIYCALKYYDYVSSEWIEIYDWETISDSTTYDISDINFKLTYESSALNGYLNGNNIFNYGISNFQCTEFGIYSQGDGEMWVDNVKVYGRQVASNYGLGRDSRRSIPKSFPATPPIKN